MKTSIGLAAIILLIGVSFAVLVGIGPGSTIRAANENSDPPAAKPGKTLKPFRSAQDLKDHLLQIAERQRRDAQQVAKTEGMMANSAGAPAAAEPMSLDSVSSEAKSAKDDESVTNNQHAGVDEGGIVKVHGDHLVILRRGRLFTVKIGDNDLEPVDVVNAYAPGVNPNSDWYDEMLVSDDTVIVIGYSYARGGTEINLFDIAASGDLEYRATYHLRSNDYYSSRNYASRLIGSKLVFYTPTYLGYGDPEQGFPAVRRWHKGATDKEFHQITKPARTYHAERPIESSTASALHSVTVCDLANGGFACEGTAVVGSPGRVFYVSPANVYVWTTDWNYGGGKQKTESMLYKMPLDGSAPSALEVTGSPVDQFSFLESAGTDLNVLVRSDGGGEQMWGSEFAAGDVALLRVSTDSFSDGSQAAPAGSYRELPKPVGYTFQNRFVGRYLLYGTGSGWGQLESNDNANLFVINWSTGVVSDLHLRHGVDRIEQMGSDAVVVGTNGSDLLFSPIRLGGDPTAMPSYVRKNASQGEMRSHGFFYKADGGETGLLGLPIARQGRPGYRHLVEDSAAILFLRNDSLELDELGELGAQNTSTNDSCRASCVDWYGNARPLFIRDRVFALLGYELVEGRVKRSGIEEKRRVNYSPRYIRRIWPG